MAKGHSSAYLGLYWLICSVVAVSAKTSQSCFIKAKGNDTFPEHFRFGVSTSAYQIEGGWNADGKGPSIWDTFTHEHPELISDRSNGDVGPDSYHQFDKDLEALKELKVQFYRFSISWPRILPNGDVTSKNQKGIDYYNMVIDKLIENKIEPLVTMFHYDLPEELSQFGGFTNPIIIKYFRSYADTLFANFGDRVKMWLTFNEPKVYCEAGYGSASQPPKIYSPGLGDYLCRENTLKAHATAYRLYQEKYFHRFGGKVSISLNSEFFISKTNDEALVKRGLQYTLGFFAHPIFSSSGNYPSLIIDDIAKNSLGEGRDWPRLEPLSDYWSKIIHGSADFFSFNYYTTFYIEVANPPLGDRPSWQYDSKINSSSDPNWKKGKSSWLNCVPEGLEGILKFIRNEYQNVEVIITENGWSDEGEIKDDDRISYMGSHLQAVLNAINDGCNVTGYTAWSLVDNFEWLRGYTEKFGLYKVNMTSTKKERIAKKSACFYKKLIERRTIGHF